jgi:hypothetical protein
MTKSFKIFIIVVLALVFQLYFLMLWNTWMHGPVLDLSYRHQERVAAVYDYHLHPSPAMKATLDAELVRMHRYLDRG